MGKDSITNFADCIQSFDGSTDVNAFLREFEARIKIEKLNETQSYKLLANKISGSAFDNFMLNQDSINTYIQLKEFLIKTYDRRRKRINVVASLFSEYQKETENIEQYYLRLTFQLNDAKFEDFNSNTESGKIYLFGFIAQTIKQSLKNKLPASFDPKDLDEMMSELRNYDSYDHSFTEQSTPKVQIESQNDNSMEMFYTPNPYHKTPNRVAFRNCETPKAVPQFKHSQYNRRVAPYPSRQNYESRNLSFGHNSNFTNSPSASDSSKNYQMKAILPRR